MRYNAPCDGVTESPPGNYLLIGCNNVATEPDKVAPVTFWKGRIDELAIFHRALNAEEIKRLYKGVSPLPKKGSVNASNR